MSRWDKLLHSVARADRKRRELSVWAAQLATLGPEVLPDGALEQLHEAGYARWSKPGERTKVLADPQLGLSATGWKREPLL